MLINIRGTSGSGKSTLVRSLLECYGTKVNVKEDGRKQPIGYIYMRPLEPTAQTVVGASRGPSLAVVGHYETACGGCDTISGYEKIFDHVRKAHAAGMDVLFEGLLISGDVKWTSKLIEDKLPLKILALTTPLDVCVASINHRRMTKLAERGAQDKFEAVNPANTVAKFKTLNSCMVKLRALGADCHEASREEALPLLRQWLQI